MHSLHTGVRHNLSMGVWSSRRAKMQSSAARILTDADLVEAAQLCAVDPVAAVLAAGRVEQARQYGLRMTVGEFWGFPAEGPLVALCWAGANIVPVNPHHDPQALPAFADLAIRRAPSTSSLVGPDEDVLKLWELIRLDWRRARDIRPEQPSLAMRQPSQVVPDPLVRYTSLSDFPVVLPACVAMFTEEVGYSPILAAPQAYAERVRWLISQRRSLAHIDEGAANPDGATDRRVVFKAELGALSPEVAQVQGVWVAPDLRGQGLAVPGMAAVVAAGLQQRSIVSLYVNSYNDAALATYRSVGFERVGTYATVLF